MKLVDVPELDRTKSIIAQLHARKKERDARFRAAAHRRPQALPAPEQKALPAPAPIQKINPFDFLTIFQPVTVQTNEVSFEFPDWVNLSSRRTVQSIVREVAKKYGLTPHAIISERRPRVLTQPRFEVAWRSKNELLYSLPQIARAMGGRDHTTILHAIKTYERWQRIKAGLEQPRAADKNLDWEKVIL